MQANSNMQAEASRTTSQPPSNNRGGFPNFMQMVANKVQDQDTLSVHSNPADQRGSGQDSRQDHPNLMHTDGALPLKDADNLLNTFFGRSGPPQPQPDARVKPSGMYKFFCSSPILKLLLNIHLCNSFYKIDTFLIDY